MPRVVIYKKNSHLNTGEKYYICEESKSNEQLNGQNTFKPKAVLTAIFQQDPSPTATHVLCSATKPLAPTCVSSTITRKFRLYSCP